MRKITGFVSLLAAILLLIGLMAGCGGNMPDNSDATSTGVSAMCFRGAIYPAQKAYLCAASSIKAMREKEIPLLCGDYYFHLTKRRCYAIVISQ